MTAVVCYYSHRLRDKDPAKQAANLARAELRCGQLRELWKRTHPERVLIAPWIDLAKAGCPEVLVWGIIDVAIKGSQVVVSDLDGAQPSEGMRHERIRYQVLHVFRAIKCALGRHEAGWLGVDKNHCCHCDKEIVP